MPIQNTFQLQTKQMLLLNQRNISYLRYLKLAM